MFKLIRLAIYALVGYAAYQFVMDVVNAEPGQSGPVRDQSGRFASQRRRRGGGGDDAERGTPAIRGARMTATHVASEGEGQSEKTQNSDGGSVSHRVGRGVVR
jgi:hypothetical protein